MSFKYIAKRITDSILSFFYYDVPDDNDFDEEKPSNYEINDFKDIVREISELNSNYLNLEKKYSYLSEYMTDVDRINSRLDKGEYVRTQQLKDVLAAVFSDNQEKYSGLRDDIKILQQRIDELEQENNELRYYIDNLNGTANSTVNEFIPDVIKTSDDSHESEGFNETRPRPRLIKGSSIENIEGEYYSINSNSES